MAASDLSGVLRGRGLSARYNGRDVLRGVDLVADAGRVVGIVGPNGSGKTTLLRVLAGLLPASSGQVLLDGRPLRRFSRDEIARRVALVLQETAIPFDILVEDVVAMGRAPHQRTWQLDSSEDQRIVSRALARAGASALRGRDYNGISAGERQRVAIARALAQEPKVLLLDEPTSHLDVSAALEIAATLRALARDRMAVVAVVHDLTLAARLSDEVLIMSEGECVARGTPAETFEPRILSRVFRAEFAVRDVGGALAVVATSGGGVRA